MAEPIPPSVGSTPPIAPASATSPGRPGSGLAFRAVLDDLERIGTRAGTPTPAAPEAVPEAMQVAENLYIELMQARRQLETAYRSARPDGSA